MVCSGHHPLAQIVKRLSESVPVVKIPMFAKEQQSVKCRRPDNVLQTGNKFCELCEEVSQGSGFLCRLYHDLESLFSEPCVSRLIGVYHGRTGTTSIRVLPLASLNKPAEMVKESDDSAIFLRILHKM